MWVSTYLVQHNLLMWNCTISQSLGLLCQTCGQIERNKFATSRSSFADTLSGILLSDACFFFSHNTNGIVERK